MNTAANDTRLDPAREAVVFTLPLYEMARMRGATSPREHALLGFAAQEADSQLRWVNTFMHTRRLLTPRDRQVVTPNNDTLYSNAWLDLSHGPVLIETPDMGERYWTLGFLDMWTNPFAHAGRRTTGNRAQRLFVHGPRWQGRVPAGCIGIAAPGDDVWIIGRILVDPDAGDIAQVNALQQRFAILRADGSGEPAVRALDAMIDGRKTAVPQASQFREIVHALWARNPAPDSHAAQIANAAAAGLAPGRSDARAGTDDAPLQRALDAVCAELRASVQASDIGGGWNLPVMVRSDYGEQYLLRARVARNLIGALGIEEAMYAIGEVDAQGLPLEGRHAYELYFAPGKVPEVDAFWSLTLYRKSDCMLVENAIERYSIGDRTPGLRWEADGGLRIRLQVTDPGPGHNWLPAPQDAFYVALRLYQPRAVHLEQRYHYPAVSRLA